MHEVRVMEFNCIYSGVFICASSKRTRYCPFGAQFPRDKFNLFAILVIPSCNYAEVQNIFLPLSNLLSLICYIGVT